MPHIDASSVTLKSKQVRLWEENEKQLLLIRQESGDEYSLAMMANMAIRRGLKALGEQLKKVEEKHD